MVCNKARGGRALRIAVGMAALVLLLDGGTALDANECGGVNMRDPSCGELGTGRKR